MLVFGRQVIRFGQRCPRWSRPSVAARMHARAASSSTIAPHVLSKALDHGDRVAVLPVRPTAAATAKAAWTYAQLLDAALHLRGDLQARLPAAISAADQPRVAFLGARGPAYTVMQWAIWLAGAIAVPLHPTHPAEELQYIMDDSGAAALLVSPELQRSAALQSFVGQVKAAGRVAVLEHDTPAVPASVVAALSTDQEDAVRDWVARCDHGRAGAHIVYTSGTTGRPKGVVTTHAALTAQIHDVVQAWEMTQDDHLLHFLPLHHVHGILNNLLCVQYAGGSVEFIPSAKPDVLWASLASSTRPVTMLMAVPTIYMNLLEAMDEWQATSKPTTGAMANHSLESAIKGARQLRVAISGSMACPVSILNRWEALTGHRLLERYGMTELGMVLTNPLHGDRHLGYVGAPFPSVSVRLVDSDTEQELALDSEHEGELRVRGPSVFREYWNKPDATAEEFDAEGWFKTGDIAQYSNERKSFRIRGRASADIIKSGGYKISALDIERVLLTHPQVQECAVFGMPDDKWGQIVAVALRTSSSDVTTPEQLTPPLVEFAKEHLADYRVPRRQFVVDAIPKNAMGKVNKKSLAVYFQDSRSP